MRRLADLAALAVLVGSLIAPTDAMARGCTSQSECRACFDGTLLNPLGLAPQCDEVQDLIDSRTEQIADANERYTICASQAGGTGTQQPGRCRPVVQRLNSCARKRAVRSGRIWTRFKVRVRRRCTPQLLSTANRALRDCNRSADCPCEAPLATTTTSTTATTATTAATTTTTTTSTTTTATTTTTTTTTGSGRDTSTTTTTATSTTSTTRGEPLPIDPTGSTCQLNCIRRVAADCYDDCQSSCGSAVNALPFCQQTCRNHQCTQLTELCTAPDDFDSANPQGRNEEYYACCRRTDECDDDDDVSLACRQAETTGPETTTTTLPGATTTTLSAF